MFKHEPIVGIRPVRSLVRIVFDRTWFVIRHVPVVSRTVHGLGRVTAEWYEPTRLKGTVLERSSTCTVRAFVVMLPVTRLTVCRGKRPGSAAVCFFVRLVHVPSPRCLNVIFVYFLLLYLNIVSDLVRDRLNWMCGNSVDPPPSRSYMFWPIIKIK